MRDFCYNDVLSALGHIKGGIPVQRLTSRIRLGEHRSRYYGPSFNLYDIKEYEPESDPPNMIVEVPGGDEDTTYARRCIEDHEVKVNFFVDLSSSIDTGIQSQKRRMLLEAIGFVGATGIRYQDPVGLCGFTDKVILNLKPKCGKMNFYYLLKKVYDFLEHSENTTGKRKPRKTDFFAALEFIRRYFDKPCFIPVISDFVDFDKVISSRLFKLVASRHEFIFIFLDDPQEYHSGKGWGYVITRDIETGRRVIVRRSKLIQAEREMRQRRKELRRQLRKMGIHSVVLEYGKHFKRLRRFFMARRKSIGR
jgi:uncharacterized protein (DUF58 family)